MRRLAPLVVAVLLVGQGVSAQDALDEAVERARAAWMRHEVDALLATSDTVRLNVPGTASSPSMRPGQATVLLEKYLKAAEELGLDLLRIRRLADDHAYAELARAYVVKGTSEERRERVLFGFRQLDGTWRLREVRVTP
jgi:hypothetical protein